MKRISKVIKNIVNLTLAFGMSEFIFHSYAIAHLAQERRNSQLVLADYHVLKAVGAKTVEVNEELNLAFGLITDEQARKISTFNHASGKCGGFETIASLAQADISNLKADLNHLMDMKTKEDQYSMMSIYTQNSPVNPAISAAIDEVKEDNLKATVEWLSSFQTRFNKAPNPNEHVIAFKEKLDSLMKNSTLPYEIEVLDHHSTAQKSIRVRLIGSKRPDEILVLGAHLDSINQSFWTGDRRAPGADDNASGSANILEALRILSTKTQPARTLEFYWYAGEESGLLGSAEIASTYKESNKKVIAVMQLDMTLFPGLGEGTIGSVTDFTSPWLRDYLKAINENYLHQNIVEFACGYGCSDHASWYRQGFPTFSPFESSLKQINHSLHTALDVISPKLNFKHSAVFAKIAVIFAMDMGNTNQTQPY